MLSGALSVEQADGAARTATLVWTLLNEGDVERSADLPSSLGVSVSGNGREQLLQAMLVDAGQDAPTRVALAPGRFHRARYRIDLPPAFRGPTVFRVGSGGLALAAVADVPAAVAVAGEDRTGEPIAAAIGVAETQAARSGGPGAAQASMTDRLGSGISRHEPNYIAFGVRERRNARFQISFKFRFFNEDGDLAQELAPLRHLYFGYTQIALWDLESDSAPFRDSSYRPSLFYRNDLLWTSAAGATALGLAAGLEHESNGRDGLSSRSINTAYVRPSLRLGRPGGWQLTLGPKFHAYLDRSGNPDIARYRGHADLFASIGHPDHWQFAATLRRGSANDAGSTMLEASYPLRAVSLGNLDGYLFFQYFNGYGESILDYDRRFPAQFRVGFAITRWP